MNSTSAEASERHCPSGKTNSRYPTAVISRTLLLLTFTCVTSAVVETRAASDEATTTSWHANTRKTFEDGVTVTSEGTAVFATGETAHVVLKGVAGPQAAWY